MSEVAIITIPLNDWQKLNEQIQDIAKSLLEIKTKDKSELLTPKECCELLKCSRNTFQSYIEKGILTAIKMKSEKYSKVLVKRSELDFFLCSRAN
jgi:excisionase family DNA binding protein